MINVVSVRVGTKYGPEYVAILHDMLGRNLSTVEHRHWCVTDAPDELPEGVTAIEPNPALPGWWQKVWLFSPQMPWEQGERIAFFDLDVAITGRLEDLVERKGIIQDELWPCFNSSVMVWDHGEHADVWRRFRASLMTEPGMCVPAECLPKGQINGGDQEWITELGGWETFPKGWCVSYKTGATIWPPTDAKVVIFNGQPKPHECRGWVEEVWRIGGLTSLPVMTGVNVTYDRIWNNIRSSVQRDLPWFSGHDPRKGTVVLCCGGPSLKASLPAIRDHKRRGAVVVSVNNALSYLLEHGVTPSSHVMLDARAENAEFVRGGPDIRYFIASQCHPDVFDVLEGKNVIVWHNAVGDGEELDRIARPHERPDRPLIQVPGGCTVGLRAMWLIWFSGFRRLHVYGMDGSYEDGFHHAYAQTLNDGEGVLQLRMGDKHYACATWMARQAEEFRGTWADLQRYGMQLFIHGRGLIPDMARGMAASQEAA